MAVIKNDRDVLLQSAPYRLSDTLVDVTSTAGAFITAKNGGTTLPATITLTANTNNVFTAASVKTWHYSLNTTPDTWVLLGTGNTRAITAASILAIIGTATEINYRCTVTEPLLNTAYDFFKVTYSKEVSDPIVVDISRTNAVIASDSEGTPLGYTNTDTVIKVTRGGVLNYSATANVANTFTVAAPTLSAGLSIGAPVTTATSYGIGNITGVTQDYSTATFVVTVYNAQGVAEVPTIAKQIVYTKVTNGLVGGNAVVNYIETSSPIISKSTSSASIAGTHSNITVVGKRITGSGLPVVAGFLTITANGDTEATLATLGPITTNINNSAGKTSYTVKLYDQNTVATANLLDTEVIPVIFTGSSAITVSLSNDSTSIPTNSAGTAGVYTNSGTTIYTYEGVSVLTYDGTGTSAGTWKVVVDQASSIDAGAITDSGTFATIGQATNMIADTAFVRYLITGTTLGGQAFSILKTQTFSKALAGTQGLSTFVGTVYLQAASAPATPTASTGSYNFSNSTLTAPAGWSNTQPATSAILGTYASTFTFVGAPTSTVTAGTWSTVRLEAKNGIDGASPEYRDTIQLYGITSTAPTSAFYNFTNNTISSTSPAVTAVPNWSLSMPAVTTSPVYMTTKLASTLTPTTDVTLTGWSTPVVVAQKGAEGTSTFVATVYLQAASAPAVPTINTGTYNFSNSTLTPPAGWSVSQPATSTVPTYASTFTFVGAPTATVTAGTWSAVRLEAQNGSPGNNGEYRDQVQLFGLTTTVPTTAYYNFTNNTISSTTPTVTAVPNWSLSMPTVTTSPVYMTTKLASTTTPATDVTLTGWSSAIVVAQKGAEGTSTFVATVYLQAASAPATPTASTGSYNFNTNTLTPPAGWSVSQPATSINGTYASTFTFVGAPTATVTAGTWSTVRLEAQNGSPGSNGEYRDVIQLFGTSTVVPTTAYYNFTNNTISSSNISVVAVTNWSLSMPTVTTTPVYMTTALAATTTPATNVTLSTWTPAVLVAQKGSTGDPGASGTKSITISAFKWDTSIGTFAAAFNYTWSSGAVSAYPAGWTASAPASTANGQTLYQINLTITALATDTVTATNWSSAVSNTIGYRADGTQGLQGNSSRTAYTVTTSSTAPTGIVAGVGDVPPTGPGTWSFTATSTLSDGQYMYQTDGILVTGSNITWNLAYLSNLKVGSLSALSANLGTVAIGTTGALYSTGKTYGGATGGVFLGYNSTAYKFDVGNSTNYLRWDGSGLEMTGTLRAGQTAYNTGTGFFLGSNGTFSLGNSAGNRLTWDGTNLNVVGGGTFSGALSAATGSFAGSLSAATGSFSGSLSAASGSFAGSLSAATGTFSGTLTASAINAVNTINIAGAAITEHFLAQYNSTATVSGTVMTTLSFTVPAGQTWQITTTGTCQLTAETTTSGGFPSSSATAQVQLQYAGVAVNTSGVTASAGDGAYAVQRGLAAVQHTAVYTSGQSVVVRLVALVTSGGYPSTTAFSASAGRMLVFVSKR